MFVVRIFALLALLLCLPARAEPPWQVAGDQAFPPYAYFDPASGQPAGLDTEIVRAVLDAVEQPHEIRLYPWERVKKMLEYRQVDLAYQFVGTPERMAQYRLVGPIRNGITVLMSRRDGPADFRSLDELAPYTIGTVLGFAYTEAFDKAPLKKDSGAINPQQLMQKLLLKRVDLIVGDKAQLLHLAREAGAEKELRVVGRPLAEVPRYVGFAKDDEAKARRFAEGLELIRRNGTLDRILARWQ